MNPNQCNKCDGSGWMWPNLGVNIPAGAAWSVSSNQALAMASGANYYIQCQACNCDGIKPHPDQGRMDAARRLHEAACRSSHPHRILFDGTNIVDQWSREPRKYRYRKEGEHE